MGKLSDLDVAWEHAAAARAQGDTSAEATALALLEQALYDERRGEEAAEIGRQVIELAKRCPDKREILQLRCEMWIRRGERLEETADGNDILLLKAAHSAYRQALSTLDAIEDGPLAGIEQPPRPSLGGGLRAAQVQSPLPGRGSAELAGGVGDGSQRRGGSLREQVRERAEAVDRRRREQQEAVDRRRREQQAARNEELRNERSMASMPGPGPAHLVETIIAGFLAVKVLGPFLEEWAKKLGEQFGESTARALGRIRIKRGNQLEASVPGTHAPTILVLPAQLSDLAKLAIIDLDPAEEGVRGQTLYWCESEGAFLTLQGRFAAFRARHPEVTVSEGGQSASWSDKDGPHTLSRGSKSKLWMIQYLEDHLDR